jgi:membrane protease YdiL (CAAX protease family)
MEPNRTAVLPDPETETEPERARGSLLEWVFLGTDGLRAGWSLAIFGICGAAYFEITGGGSRDPSSAPEEISAWGTIGNESIPFFVLLAVVALMAFLERRRITAYYLEGTKRISNFAWGMLGGFVALSALIGGLYLGHWVTFGPVALSGAAVVSKALLWGIAFLLVALFEEGSFRCYLLFTFARGFISGRVGFWSAALITSILFGLVHMSNSGESQVGVFAAGGIGFVFCMSIRYTGSAWWAIGFHAAWDWAETFFYGTADSGLLAHGHFLATNPSGDPRWSGGVVGPEGSLLIFPVILLCGVAVYLGYGRRAAGRALAELTHTEN